jgi:hypothetical protein
LTINRSERRKVNATKKKKLIAEVKTIGNGERKGNERKEE